MKSRGQTGLSRHAPANPNLPSALNAVRRTAALHCTCERRHSGRLNRSRSRCSSATAAAAEAASLPPSSGASPLGLPTITRCSLLTTAWLLLSLVLLPILLLLLLLTGAPATAPGGSRCDGGGGGAVGGGSSAGKPSTSQTSTRPFLLPSVVRGCGQASIQAQE